MRLHLDIETYSDVDLTAAGVHVYAAHPSTEILVFAWAFDDEPVQLWRPTDAFPGRVLQHIADGGEVAAFNAMFERTVLNGVAGQKIGFPRIAIEQTVCVAAKAAAHGLPQSLDKAATALGLRAKDSVGHTVMLQVSKPRRGRVLRYTRLNAPEKFAKLDAYCANDVEVEREIDRAVPDLPPSEQTVYQLDQWINDRGVRMDLQAVTAASYLLEQHRANVVAECQSITGLAPTQRGRLLAWLHERKVTLPDMQADTIRQAYQSWRGDAQSRRVLELYEAANSKAASKLEAMLAGVGADERLRGLFLYHGAGPGRWSSRRVQLHNLARGVVADPAAAVEAVLGRDLEWLVMLYPDTDPADVIGSCIRGMLVAAPERSLCAMDYSGIESRVNAWLFGEEWKLAAFREYDNGSGPGIYETVYAQAFNKPVERVAAAERQIGKVLELASGYQGGVGAFVNMAKNYGIALDQMAEQLLTGGALPDTVWARACRAWEEHAKPKQATFGLREQTYAVCDSLKQLWRSSNPRITAGWLALEEGARSAIESPGRVFALPGRKLSFCVKDRWLYLRLPSGRKIAYFSPEDVNGRLTYMGVDTLTRQWGRTQMYGGMLCNNAVQGAARDLLVSAMLQLDQRFPDSLVMTVHDEVVLELKDPDIDAIQQTMIQEPAWATGLPLAVKGWVGERYRK